ncbi:ArsR/SmtB family transcription factor [Hyphococcus sp.]|uniref:ArsR/SmtB family transcription factor n=1 Tax=Hyphococcus sp. TaxID=2038636 RepID=UPI0020818EFD|nr:MAG: transcriptional regulator [Marinicaulis sp.]
MKQAAVDSSFAALADPQRRRVVELLSERPRRAGELSAAVKISAPAMSRHLKALKESGLIVETHPEFDARVRIYALRREGLEALKAWVGKTESMWSRQLTAFKDHIENDSS